MKIHHGFRFASAKTLIVPIVSAVTGVALAGAVPVQAAEGCGSFGYQGLGWRNGDG